MEKELKNNNQMSGCFMLGLRLFVIMAGVWYIISGEIIMQSEGIYIQGVRARIIGLLFIVICLVPFAKKKV